MEDRVFLSLYFLLKCPTKLNFIYSARLTGGWRQASFFALRDKQIRLSFPILVMLIKIIEHVIAHAMRVVFCLEEIDPYFESKAFCYAT